MKKISLIILVAATLAACKKSKDVTVAAPVTYVAGFENNGSNSVAKLWKDGVATSLSDGTRPAVARSVFVSGSDVYVCGDEYNGTNSNVVLWKNGVRTDITAGSLHSIATRMYVKGSDVYIAGSQRSSSGVDRAVYWKNGVINFLTAGTYRGNATEIIVTEDDNVYVSGYEGNGTVFVAKVWRNGVQTVLGNGTYHSAGRGLALQGTTAVIGGYHLNSAGLVSALVWPAATYISGSAQCDIYDVFTEGSDLYAVGYEYRSGKYAALSWKNGVETVIGDPVKNTFPYGMFVLNATTYIAGTDATPGGGISRALMWKNGVATALTDGSRQAEAYAVFVK